MESAAKRISIMGICNKVAGVSAPFILGAIVLNNADALVANLKVADLAQKTELLNELSSRVIMPYSLMAATLVILAFLVLLSPLPDIDNEEDTISSDEINVHKSSIFQFPNLVLGVLALFLYVGVEVMAGDTIGSYGQSQGIGLSIAKNFTAYTLTAMVIGYILGIISIPKLISQSRALGLSAIIGVIFTIIAVSTHGYISVLFIALLGLANALMWPAIWPLAINGLGKYTKTGSAMLIMAIAGGATLPLIYGKLADIEFIGHQQAYWIMAPCYIFILYYSIKGHKIKSWKNSK
jgi:MFS transporter, FHS family, L-fucose permease